MSHVGLDFKRFILLSSQIPGLSSEAHTPTPWYRQVTWTHKTWLCPYEALGHLWHATQSGERVGFHWHELAATSTIPLPVVYKNCWLPVWASTPRPSLRRLQPARAHPREMVAALHSPSQPVTGVGPPTLRQKERTYRRRLTSD